MKVFFLFLLLRECKIKCSFFLRRLFLIKWWNCSLKLKYGGKNIGYLVFIMFINCDYSFKCWMLMYEGSGRVLLFFFYYVSFNFIYEYMDNV